VPTGCHHNIDDETKISKRIRTKRVPLQRSLFWRAIINLLYSPLPEVPVYLEGFAQGIRVADERKWRN